MVQDKKTSQSSKETPRFFDKSKLNKILNSSGLNSFSKERLKNSIYNLDFSYFVWEISFKFVWPDLTDIGLLAVSTNQMSALDVLANGNVGPKISI